MRFHKSLDLLNDLGLKWYEHKPKHVIPVRYVYHYVDGLVKVLRVPQEQAEWVVYWMSVLTWSTTKQCTLADWLENSGPMRSPCDALDTFCHWQSSLFQGDLMSTMSGHKRWI